MINSINVGIHQYGGWYTTGICWAIFVNGKIVFETAYYKEFREEFNKYKDKVPTFKELPEEPPEDLICGIAHNNINHCDTSEISELVRDHICV